MIRITDGERKLALHRGGARQQLPPDPNQRHRGQRPLVAAKQPANDRSLAPRPERGRLPRTRDMLDDTGALDEQVVDRVVDPVEFGPQRGQTTTTPAIHGSWLLLLAGGFDCWNWAGHRSRRKGVADLYQRPLEVTRSTGALTGRRSYVLFALAGCCGVGLSENGPSDAQLSENPFGRYPLRAAPAGPMQRRDGPARDTIRLGKILQPRPCHVRRWDRA